MQEEVVAKVTDALERLGVVYMVAGSFASNFHGVPSGFECRPRPSPSRISMSRLHDGSRRASVGDEDEGRTPARSAIAGHSIAALAHELTSLGWPDDEIPGFRGPDAWYTFRPPSP